MDTCSIWWVRYDWKIISKRWDHEVQKSVHLASLSLSCFCFHRRSGRSSEMRSLNLGNSEIAFTWVVTDSKWQHAPFKNTSQVYKYALNWLQTLYFSNFPVFKRIVQHCLTNVAPSSSFSHYKDALPTVSIILWYIQWVIMMLINVASMLESYFALYYPVLHLEVVWKIRFMSSFATWWTTIKGSAGLDACCYLQNSMNKPASA